MSQWQPEYQPRTRGRQDQYGPVEPYPQRQRIQQPSPQYGQTGPPPAYYPPHQQFPRESVTMTGMSTGKIIFHWCMIVCTCGFWWPAYAAAKHRADRKSVTRYS
jgi:hypothetical protein